MLPIALTIAGSDPSGGAGIQADLKTFHQFGVYGEAAITLLTVQNTLGVSRVQVMEPQLVTEQLEAILADIPPHAAKTGALGSAGVVRAVARVMTNWDFPLVVDPVMISKHGAPLLPEDAVQVICDELVPCATLLTPNVPEAEALCSLQIRSPKDMKLAAAILRGMGAKAVLIKGGHLEGDAVDLLYSDEAFHQFPATRIDTKHTHGTGCTFSAAITASLAAGLTMVDAVARAKRFIQEAIRTNPGLGSGTGPVNHHVEVR
jgi:hydroxymethylpyrimidine/phosphomethylpyrimidine kinase